MNYEEYLFHICNTTDMSNEEEAIELVQHLVTEALKMEHVSKQCTDKLSELMNAKDYFEWSHEAAIELTKFEFEHMKDCELKEFALEHFDEIISGEYMGEEDEQQKKGE